jgi:hypothetical protein
MFASIFGGDSTPKHRRQRAKSQGGESGHGFFASIFRGFGGDGDSGASSSRARSASEGASCLGGLGRRGKNADTSGSGNLILGPTKEIIMEFNGSSFEDLPGAWAAAGVHVQFGVQLALVPKCRMEGYGGPVPAVLVVLRSELIKQQGGTAEGIFRKSPDAATAARVKRELNEGVFKGCDDVNVLASLIKTFFREMPVQLFDLLGLSANDMKEFMTMVRADQTAGFECMMLRVHALPEPGKSSLLWLLNLMGDITRHEEKNLMNAKNIATCMSPNLFYVDINTADPMQAMETARVVTDFTQVLIRAQLLARPQSWESTKL